MCDYCGCQALTAIKALTEEHDRIRTVADYACRAAAAGEVGSALAQIAQLRALLAPHTAIEERGLFPPLAGEFGEQVAVLVGEHRDLDRSLIRASAGPCSDNSDDRRRWAEDLAKAVRELFEHILHEQDGVFPAALSVLSTEHWDYLDQLRTEFTGVVHPTDPLRLSGVA